MVGTVAEFHLLEVFFKRQELFILTVAGIIAMDALQKGSELQVILTILIPKDVAPGKGGLCEIVDKLFLVERKLVETGHRVTEHLHIGETVNYRSRRV